MPGGKRGKRAYPSFSGSRPPLLRRSKLFAAAQRREERRSSGSGGVVVFVLFCCFPSLSRAGVEQGTIRGVLLAANLCRGGVLRGFVNTNARARVRFFAFASRRHVSRDEERRLGAVVNGDFLVRRRRRGFCAFR